MYLLNNAENEGVETIYQLDDNDTSTNGTYPSSINIDFINK